MALHQKDDDPLDRTHELHAEVSAQSIESKEHTDRPPRRRLTRTLSSLAGPEEGGAQHVDANDRGSLLGLKYFAYYQEKGISEEEAWAKLPPIDVTIKILELSNLKTNTGTFFCSFLVMLDWEDESLDLYSPEDKELITPEDLHDHFVPRYEIENVITTPEPVGGETEPLYDKTTTTCNRVKWTSKFRAVLTSKMNMKNYPFDIQILQIEIKARNITTRPKHIKALKMGYLHLKEPSRWRKKEGCSIASGANNMDEWTITDAIAGSGDTIQAIRDMARNTHADDSTKKNMTTLYMDQLTDDQRKRGKSQSFFLEVDVERASGNVLVNIVIIVGGLMMLSLTGFGIGIADLIDRETVVSTTFLTLIAFKWILADTVPKVRYLTVMEFYMFLGQMQLVVQGIGNWVTAEAYLEYNCVALAESEKPLFKRAIEAGEDKSAIATCNMIRYIDRILLLLHVIFFIGTQLYMYVKAITRRQTSIHEGITALRSEKFQRKFEETGHGKLVVH